MVRRTAKVKTDNPMRKSVRDIARQQAMEYHICWTEQNQIRRLTIHGGQFSLGMLCLRLLAPGCVEN